MLLIICQNTRRITYHETFDSVTNLMVYVVDLPLYIYSYYYGVKKYWHIKFSYHFLFDMCLLLCLYYYN